MTTPLIYSYLKKFQEDPRSRVFAPLAEAYRKAGLIDEAIEIAREGLQVHPQFVGGRVALARALFDRKLYGDVVKELAEIVRDVPDNLVAQRLFAESSLMIGQATEALNAYKMLLYFNPQDPETARIVNELEMQSIQKKEALVVEEKRTQFDVRSAKLAIREAPDTKKRQWMWKIERLQLLLQKVERYRQNIA